MKDWRDYYDKDTNYIGEDTNTNEDENEKLKKLKVKNPNQHQTDKQM